MKHAAEMKPEGHMQSSETHHEAAPPISTDCSGSGEDRRILALPARLRARWQDSPWLPVVARGAAVLGTLGALAIVGATRTGEAPGVPLESPRDGTQVAGVWLAPSPAPSPRHAAVPSAEARAAEPVPVPAASTDPAETRNGKDTEEGGPPPEDATSGITPDGKVILNQATAAELTRLPRVGPKRASAIVALRERLGRFRKPTDLLRVKGIGVKTLRKMLPHLVVDAPKG